jgi:hypothetical protein
MEAGLAHLGHYLLHISFSSGASPKVDAGGRAITIMPLFAGFPLSVNITLKKCAFSIYSIAKQHKISECN